MAKRRKKKSSGSSNTSLFLLFAFVFMAFLGYLAWNSIGSGSLAFLSPESTSVTSKTIEKEGSLTEKLTKTMEKAATAITKEEKKSNEVSKSPEVSQPDKVSSTSTKKSNASSAKAKMAIVLDDFGMSYEMVEKYNAMGVPFTYAVIPYKPYSAEIAKAGVAAGQDIIVHLPMESEGDVTPEATTIRTSMSDGEIRSTAAKALDSIPYAIGVNNHQGSKATASKRTMELVMKEVAKRGFFFLDSRTSSDSVVTSVARNQGVLTGENELFIDNSSDVDDIKDKLQEAANRALRSPEKSIIVIGHARPNTVKAVGEMIDSLRSQGIEFVLVRTLLY